MYTDLCISSTSDVLLCTLLYSIVQDTVLQNLYFKLRMSGSKREDRMESSKEPEPVPSMSDMSEITAYPTSIADSPSALLSPTSSPSSSQ